MRNHVFSISDQVRHKPGCTATEDGQKLTIVGSRCTIYEAKTKSLISGALTARLIGTFAFASAKKRFSHEAAHFIRHFDTAYDELTAIISNNLFLSLLKEDKNFLFYENTKWHQTKTVILFVNRMC